MHTAKNFVLLGSSGSGKGTQARLIVERFGNLHHISTGELFRNLAAAKTRVSKGVADIMGRGKFPPHYLAIALLINTMSFRIREGEGFVLDGFPRSVTQARILDSFLNLLQEAENTSIIFIDVSSDEASKRMIGRNDSSRSDDTPEAIKSRLDLFEKEVKPVLDYYDSRGRLIKVNGEQGILGVHREIIMKTLHNSMQGMTR